MSLSITQKDNKEIFQDACDFESSRIAMTAKSERRAWTSFSLSMLVNVLLVTAVVVLVTKQTLFPYLVSVDRNTGESEIISILNKASVSTNEAMDRFWLANYVRWHESYNFMTIQSDYDNTLLFSTDGVGAQYRAIYEGDHARDEVWGKRLEAMVKILTIIPEKDGIARVRFAKTIRPTDSAKGQTTVWVATIGYTYDTHLKLTAKDRRKNPLGFQVTSFRVDPELRG